MAQELYQTRHWYWSNHTHCTDHTQVLYRPHLGKDHIHVLYQTTPVCCIRPHPGFVQTTPMCCIRPHPGFVQTTPVCCIRPHPGTVQTTPMCCIRPHPASVKTTAMCCIRPHPGFVQTTPMCCIRPHPSSVQTTPRYCTDHTQVLYTPPQTPRCGCFTCTLCVTSTASLQILCDGGGWSVSYDVMYYEPKPVPATTTIPSSTLRPTSSSTTSPTESPTTNPLTEANPSKPDCPGAYYSMWTVPEAKTSVWCTVYICTYTCVYISKLTIHNIDIGRA